MILSLIAALVICVLLLAAFGLFTHTPLGRRIELDERRRGERLGRGATRRDVTQS